MIKKLIFLIVLTYKKPQIHIKINFDNLPFFLEDIYLFKFS